MDILDIAGRTRLFGAPKDWNAERDGPCGALPIRDELYAPGVNRMVSEWKPNEIELEHLKLGAPIQLGIIGIIHPVVSLGVGAVPPREREEPVAIDHEFKSHPSVFYSAKRGEKNFEYRRDDRGGYHVGQTVRLRCYDAESREYLPEQPLDRVITNILRGGEFELPEGFCILALAPLEASASPPPTEDLAGQGEPLAAWIRRAIMANLKGEADGVDEAVAVIVSNLKASAPDLAGQGEPVAWALELADAFERSGKTLFFPEQFPVGYPAGWDAAHCECAKDLRHAAKYPPAAAPAPSRPADREEIARVIREATELVDTIGLRRVRAFWDVTLAEVADRIIALRDAPRNGGDGTKAAYEELARIRAVIPASLAYEVPDMAEAIASTFREYVKVAAEATALRKQIAGMAGLTNCSIHSVSDSERGRYTVQIGCPDLPTTQDITEALDHIRKETRSPAADSLALRDAPRNGGDGTQAARDVLAERRRQVEAEGWTPKHDDKHSRGEMAKAAAAYAMPSTFRGLVMSPYSGDTVRDRLWPWDEAWWKPARLGRDRRRDLVKAGALILAEIERLDRLPSPNAGDGTQEDHR